MSRRLALSAVALAALTFGVFMPVATFQFVSIDDPTYVVRNPLVTAGLTWSGVIDAFTTLHAANWHPLTWLSHMADVELFGLRAGAHHLTNLALHTINTVMLFALLARVTGAAGRSAFVAALFAVHPLHVESVAWVSERKDVLSTFFWLATIAAYAWYVRLRSLRRYVAVVALFAIGLLAKPMLVTLPIVLILMDWWPLRRVPTGTMSRTSLLDKIPLLALAIGSAVITVIAQRAGGAVMPFGARPLGLRAENAVVGVTTYLGKMVWPINLTVYYPPPLSFDALTVGLSGVLLVGLTAFAVTLRHRAPYMLTGWGWYLVSLVPVVGLVQVGRQAMADRYTYVPLTGVFVAIAWGVAALAGRWRLPRPVLPIAAMLIIGACAAATRAQVAHWRNDTTLWTHALRQQPALDPRLVPAAVQDLLAEGDRGLTMIQALLEMTPQTRAPAHRVLGDVFSRHSHLDEAIAAYREAVRLDPTAAEVHNNLGFALARRGRLTEALTHFAESVRLGPDLVDARKNYGLALAQLGRYDEAAREFEEVLRRRPQDSQVREALETLRSRK